MKRALTSALTLAATSALVAACGTSSNSSTHSTGSGSAAGSTQPASSAGGAYGSVYGSGSSAQPSSSAGSGTATEVTTKHSKLGAILAAGPKQLTVYLFEADKGPSSACSGACATAWPPVTTSGSATAGGQAVTARIGTISRADGTKQVTYNGHPLYYFVKDKDSGDAYGQGATAFGAQWYTLAPSGQKVDNS